MMTPKDIERARYLVGERNRIASTHWTGLAYASPGRGSGYEVQEIDEELKEAIERWRERRLAPIHAELKAMGVDPGEAPKAKT